MLPAHAPSAVQEAPLSAVPTHLPPVTLVSQVPPPLHGALALQTTQVWATVSQTWGEVQSAFLTHPTHWPPATEVSQAWPEGQATFALQITQACATVSQTFGEEQSALSRHATHLPPLLPRQ